MDDIGLFEIIVILGIVGIGIYFVAKLFKSVPTPCQVPGKIADAVSKAVGQAAQKVAGPVCTNPTPPQPQGNLSTGQKFFNWLGNLFGLSGGVNAQDKYYNPPPVPQPTLPPATSTGVPPGAGQPCGCNDAVLRCCSGYCCLNYSIGG